MSLIRGGLITPNSAGGGGAGSLSGFAGVTILEGLSGVIDIDSTNDSITISTTGQVINLEALFTPASGAVVDSKAIAIDYSTSEQDTGLKWINGSGVYQKTISFGALPDSGQKTVAHGITGLHTLISLWAIAKNPSSPSDWKTIPHTSAAALSNSINVEVDETNIEIGTGTDRTDYTETYVTLRYTKS